MGILITALLFLGFAAVYFGWRFVSLKKGLQAAEQELAEIALCLSENRLVHLPCPDRDLEQLLISVNLILQNIKKERIRAKCKEQEFRKQLEHISHDLRTPLTSILGYLKLLDVQALSPEDRESFLIVERKSGYLQRLISQFYDLSQLLSGDFEPEIKCVDAGRMLRETLLMSYQELENRGIDVTTEIPDRPVCVWADEDALLRIFSNLLSNAGRYAAGMFLVRVSQEKDWTFFHWENDARELSEADVPHLFEQFYMADNARSAGGTGLGLTIARQLSEAMGGSMEAMLRGEEKKLVFLLKIPTASQQEGSGGD